MGGLLPARWLGRALGEQRAHFRGRLLCARGSDPGTLGPGVADGEHACRRSGLAEALVVLEDLVDEIGRLPDLDRAVCVAARRLLGREADGDDDREIRLVDLLAEVRVPREPERVARALDDRRVRDMRPAEERGDLGRHLPGLRVERLAPAEDEIGALLLDRQRERSRRPERVRDREHAIREVDRPLGAERERVAQRLLGLRRAHGHRHDLVGEQGGVLHGIAVEGVQLERHAFALERMRLLVELDRRRARAPA